jgi:beta-lactam-binding protein with PASTA domain
MDDQQSGAMAGDPADLVGRTIAGRFRLERVVSQSSTAGVFVAVDEETERSTSMRLFTAEATASFGTEFAERVEAARAVRHRTIVPVVSTGITEIDGRSCFYVVSERPTGGTLQDMLDRGRLLTPSQAVVVGVDVCRALDRAHRSGVSHFDLRPSAITFTENHEVALADLGITALVAERAWESPSDVSMERARYASPEQAAGGTFDEKSDVYALALVLAESITGAVPFLADSVVATLSGRQDRRFPVSADLGALATVLERAGRADPFERFGAADLGRALVAAAGTLPRPTPPPIVATDATGDIARPVLEMPATADLSRPTEFTGVETASAVPVVADGGMIIRPETSDDVPVDPTGSVEQPRVGRWVVGAVAVLVLVVGGFFLYRAIADDGSPVPILAGLDEGEATNAVTEFGWVIETVEEFSDDFDTGQVIRTEPEAGSDLSDGAVLTLVVSSGPPPVPLPDIVGEPADTALTTLANLGLEVRRLDGFSEEYPVGAVARWEVASQPNLVAGSEVVKGTVVDVYVSTGPEPRVVPELRGQTYDAAVAILDELKLKVRRVDDQYFTDVPAGAVGFMVPPPGELVERDSEVTIVISKGPDVVTVPVLSRLNHDQVVQALNDAGLVVGSVTGNTRGVLVAILANGQPITTGQVVARGTVVELAYYGS